MKVDGVFHSKKVGKIVSGFSKWNDNLQYKVGDILCCGSKSWKVIGVDKIYQGCFGTPKERWHVLKLESIDHNDQPNNGDELIKQ